MCNTSDQFASSFSSQARSSGTHSHSREQMPCPFPSSPSVSHAYRRAATSPEILSCNTACAVALCASLYAPLHHQTSRISSTIVLCDGSTHQLRRLRFCRSCCAIAAPRCPCSPALWPAEHQQLASQLQLLHVVLPAQGGSVVLQPLQPQGDAPEGAMRTALLSWR